MKIFIAGPRAITSLDENVEAKLNSIIEKGFEVLVGDANGVDRLVQSFFSKKGYSKVTIYATNGIARNNIGLWVVQNVPVDKSVKGFKFYAAKDEQMSNDADLGFMIWNGISKGTLNNIINLSKQGKQVIVYLTSLKKLLCLDNLESTEKLAYSCGNNTAKAYNDLVKTGSQSDGKQLSLDTIAK